jgi:hypothetical protein
MDNFFKTDDISIAAFCLSRGAQIVEVVTDRPTHFIFVFSDFEKCQELKREYLNNGVAPARELFARREELISEMKDRNRYGGNYDRNKR